MAIGEYYQRADWKTEKHVPVIECPDKVKAGEMFEVKASLGKEIAHPNTTEHHIRWISIYFKPDNDKFIYQIGKFEFTAHGECVAGVDKGPVHTDHCVTCRMKTNDAGRLISTAYCNIHGLWEYEKAVKIG